MYQPLCDAISLILDVRRVTLSRIDKAVRLLVHVVDAVLVGDDVSLDQLVLLHQILDEGRPGLRPESDAELIGCQQGQLLAQPEIMVLQRGQVLAQLVGCQQGLHLTQPEVQVLQNKTS